MLQLHFDNWQLDVVKNETRALDNLAYEVVVDGDLPGNWIWLLYIEACGNFNSVALAGNEDGTVSALLTRDILAFGDEQYTLQLVGVDGDKKRHTNEVNVFVGRSISGDGVWPSVPSAFSQIEQNVLAAVSHYPYVDNTTKTWIMWDVQNDEWRDTGLRAEGTKGDTGDSAYEEAVELGFVGTEAEWIASLKGEKGDTGFSPEITSSAIPGGHRIDIYNELGPDSFNVMDGVDGTDGEDGEDGVSPTVAVADIAGGHRVTITDADGAHTFDVMDGVGGSGSADAVLYTPQSLSDSQKTQARTNVGAGTYSKPSGGIPKTDLAQAVQTSLGKADTALQPDALETELDDNVPPVRFVLVMNGNTLTTVETFARIAMLLTSTARRVMFGVVLAQSGGNPTSILELYPTLIDTSNRLLTLVGEHDGDRYTAELTAASASSTMTGTLVVEPIVTESDIPTKTSDLTNDSGFQTAPFEIEITGSGTTYTTTATAQQILDNADNCVAVFSNGVEKAKPDAVFRNGATAVSIQFTVGIVVVGYLGVTQIVVSAANGSVDVAVNDTQLNPLPSVTASDNGKFLRVVNGAWAAETVSTWQGGSY